MNTHREPENRCGLESGGPRGYPGGKIASTHSASADVRPHGKVDAAGFAAQITRVWAGMTLTPTPVVSDT